MCFTQQLPGPFGVIPLSIDDMRQEVSTYYLRKKSEKRANKNGKQKATAYKCMFVFCIFVAFLQIVFFLPH